jgi:AraC-like DNA-binding protein
MQSVVSLPEEKKLSTLQFNPDAMRPAERFELFSQRVRYYDVRKPDDESLATFDISSMHWHLGGASAGRVRYASRDMVRTSRHVRNDQLDHYRVILQQEGTCHVDADGVRRTVGPGQILLTDLARPESILAPTSGSYSVFFLPREIVDEALPQPVDLHGLVPGGVAQAILGDHLASLMRHVEHLTASEAGALSRSIVTMLAAAIAPSAATLGPARATIEATVLRQACRYIDLHLSESDLNADKLATFLRISRASVYRLFEPLGGVSAYVKERRLDRLHEILSSASQNLYLARLAEEHGFSSAAQFSRVFKARYGYNPSEAKGRPLETASPMIQPTTTVDGLFDWLRGLRG